MSNVYLLLLVLLPLVLNNQNNWSSKT